MKFIPVIILCLFSFIDLSAQNTDSLKAMEIAGEAIENLNAGHAKKALKLINSAIKLSPENIDLYYEKALIFSNLDELDSAISLLEKYYEDERANDRYYQLLGKCYYFKHDDEKAREIYELGVVRFRNSGLLYCELGNYWLDKLQTRNVIGYYEKAIIADPNYPLSYYMLSKLLNSTANKLWSILYGEFFINFSSDLNYCTEISTGIYEAYTNSIIRNGKTVDIHFIDLAKDPDYFPDDSLLKFEQAYHKVMAEAVKKVIFDKTITIENISDLRTNFIKIWYKKGFDKQFDIPLFELNKQMLDKGFFKHYNYYLLKDGRPDEFEKWMEKNQLQFIDFANWYYENMLKLTKENSVYESKFE